MAFYSLLTLLFTDNGHFEQKFNFYCWSFLMIKLNLISTEYRMVKFEQNDQQVCKNIQVSALYKK